MDTDTLYPYGSCRTPTCRTRPSPGFADRGLCYFCEHAGVEAVTALAGDWLALQPLMWDKPVMGLRETTSMPKPGPTVPVNLHVDELATLIVYTATLWDQVVRERARLADPPSHDTPAAGITRAALTLTAHFAVLLATPPVDCYPTPDAATTSSMDGPDAIVALTSLHHRAAATIGLTERHEALPAPCHLCGWAQLRRRVGADTVFCPRCHTEWTWDLYREVQEHTLFTPPTPTRPRKEPRAA